MNNSHDKFTQLKVGKNLSFSVLASYNNYGCCCPVAISIGHKQFYRQLFQSCQDVILFQFLYAILNMVTHVVYSYFKLFGHNCHTQQFYQILFQLCKDGCIPGHRRSLCRFVWERWI